MNKDEGEDSTLVEVIASALGGLFYSTLFVGTICLMDSLDGTAHASYADIWWYSFLAFSLGTYDTKERREALARGRKK